MAKAKGMGANYSTMGLYQKMMNNPLYQQQQQDYQASERRDNKAVSMADRHAGTMVAGEHQRMLGMDKAGSELSRRANRLEFAKKTQAFEEEQYGIKNEQTQKQLALRQRSLNEQARQINDADYGASGIEIGLGLMSTGVEIYGGYKASKQHKEWMSMMRGETDKYLGLKVPPNTYKNKGYYDAYTEVF